MRAARRCLDVAESVRYTPALPSCSSGDRRRRAVSRPINKESRMWLIFALSAALAAPPQQAPAVASATLTAANSKIWVGRYTEFEEFIRSAPIERVEDVRTGVTRPHHAFFPPGGLAGGVIV